MHWLPNYLLPTLTVRYHAIGHYLLAPAVLVGSRSAFCQPFITVFSLCTVS